MPDVFFLIITFIIHFIADAFFLPRCVVIDEKPDWRSVCFLSIKLICSSRFIIQSIGISNLLIYNIQNPKFYCSRFRNEEINVVEERCAIHGLILVLIVRNYSKNNVHKQAVIQVIVVER